MVVITVEELDEAMVVKDDSVSFSVSLVAGDDEIMTDASFSGTSSGKAADVRSGDVSLSYWLN